MVKWNNPGEGVAPTPTPRCSSYWKGSLRVTLDYSRQLNFFYSYMPSWSGIFKFGTFFQCFSSKSRCIFALGPFFMLIIRSAFLLCSLCSHISLQNCFDYLSFGISSFVCIVLSCLDIFLVFLLSPVLSGLFPRVVLCFTRWVFFFFSSQHVLAFSLCLIFFTCCSKFFFICISNQISHPCFVLLFVFFRGILILSQTNFAPE